MASLSNINRSMLRITGLNSNMDTESIVSSLLQVDQLKIDKQFKAKTKLEWQGEAYRDFNLKIKNFREKYFSALSPETNIFSSAAYDSYKVNMVDESTAFSVTASSNAYERTLAVKSIDQLASAATAKSTDIWAAGAGETISLDTTLVDAASKFATPLTFGANAHGQSAISFTINGQQFTFTSTATLNEVITTVNARAEAGVVMNYSSLSKGFTLTGRETGFESRIFIEDGLGNAFETGNAAFAIEKGAYIGKDAVVTFVEDGVETQITRNSNKFDIDGLSFVLNKTMTAAEAGSAGIQFHVERDIEPIIEKLQNFVNAYNELIAELQTAYDQRPNRAYDPLSETEKGQLTEKEAEKWEELAKEGLLYRDSNLGRLISNLRGLFYTGNGGVDKTAADIGFTTGNYFDGGGGKIVLDTGALRQALSSDPHQVKTMFANVSTATDSAANYGESGLVVKMNTLMNGYINTTNETTLYSNTKAVLDAEDKLTRLEEWLADREDSYWKKFAAMETALANLQSQTAWISSLIGTSDN
ncbi:MAG: flagellar filament capping protein FliD [Clostridiales bacterium]|jgi:flagellar hook-associated protein 2|nr:flagellar filament capping protein FliD [Clostridiales bacterium]